MIKNLHIRLILVLFFSVTLNIKLIGQASQNKIINNVEDNLLNLKNSPDVKEVTKIIYGVGGPYANLKPESEDFSRRNEFAKHFRREDGTMQAVIGAGAIHYKESGIWKTILADIFVNNSQKHPELAYVAPYNKHKLYFPATPGKSSLLI